MSHIEPSPISDNTTAENPEMPKAPPSPLRTTGASEIFNQLKLSAKTIEDEGKSIIAGQKPNDSTKDEANSAKPENTIEVSDLKPLGIEQQTEKPSSLQPPKNEEAKIPSPLSKKSPSFETTQQIDQPSSTVAEDIKITSEDLTTKLKEEIKGIEDKGKNEDIIDSHAQHKEGKKGVHSAKKDMPNKEQIPTLPLKDKSPTKEEALPKSSRRPKNVAEPLTEKKSPRHKKNGVAASLPNPPKKGENLSPRKERKHKRGKRSLKVTYTEPILPEVLPETDKTKVLKDLMGKLEVDPKPKSIKEINDIVTSQYGILSRLATEIIPESKDPEEALGRLTEMGAGLGELSKLQAKVIEIDGVNNGLRKEKIKDVPNDNKAEKEENMLNIELKSARNYLRLLKKAENAGPSLGRKNPLISDEELEATMTKHSVSLTRSKDEVERLKNEVALMERRAEEFDKRIQIMSGRRRPLFQGKE